MEQNQETSNLSSTYLGYFFTSNNEQRVEKIHSLAVVVLGSFGGGHRSGTIMQDDRPRAIVGRVFSSLDRLASGEDPSCTEVVVRQTPESVDQGALPGAREATDTDMLRVCFESLLDPLLLHRFRCDGRQEDVWLYQTHSRSVLMTPAAAHIAS